MKTIGVILSALSLCLVMASAAFAQDLGTAKSQGLVGETSSGYIAAVGSASGVDALIKDINGKRRAQYQKIASKNGISLQAVEARAGQKAISMTPAGQYVNSGGGWQKK